MGKKLTYEEVKKIVVELGYELLDKDYKNSDQKLFLKDNLGYLYFIRLDHLRNGVSPAKFHPLNPNSIYNIRLWLSINNKTYQLVSEIYTKSNDRLVFFDNEGYFYKVLWSTIYSGRIPDRFNKSNPFTIQNIRLWCDLNNTPFVLVDGSIYEDSSKNLKWNCFKCNEEFESPWHKIIGGQCCPFCHGKRIGLSNCLATKNPELAKEWHPTKNNNLTPFDVTVSTHQRVWWQCEKGHEWASAISGRNRKDNNRCCPECNESKGEKRVKQALVLFNKPYDSQYTFEDLVGLGGGLLKFDVPVFWDEEKTKLRLLIEYDGIFHYEKQYKDDGFERLQAHDKLKNTYCIKNNIPLIRIPYWEFDNIESILENILIDNNLGGEFIVR